MLLCPNAKINLGLNVVERRPDGYHNLETVFYPIPVEDVLEVVPVSPEADGCFATGNQSLRSHAPLEGGSVLHTSGVEIAGDPEGNLVVKAYRLLQREFGLPAVHICLHKSIPSGAGLGGGSADATFMLRILRQLFDLPLTDAELEVRASSLGADCAFFVQNRPAFATGIGDVFTPLPSFTLKGYRLVLVKPDIFVSTRDAFARIRPHRPEVSLTDIIRLPVEQWRQAGMTNDFEESVFAIHPAIGDIKEQLYGMGAPYAAMSGSGSSLFALFRPGDECPREAELKERFPGSFCRVCAL